MATERQLKILNLILSEYVINGEPVASGTIIEKNPDLNISPALVRQEMVALENEGYITKLGFSSGRASGRVPTNKGYQHYLQSIQSNPNSILSIKKRLDEILSNRKEGIDKTISEAMKLINESTNTLTITKDQVESEEIVDINSYPVGEDKAVIIIVTSTGQVINNEASLNEIKYTEFAKAIKALGKRLKNTPISELTEAVDNLGQILTIEIKDIEDKFQEVIKLLVNKVITSKSNYQGMNSLIVAETIDVKKQVKAIFEMIENNSIWELINEDGAIANTSNGLTIDVKAIDGVSIVQKEIDLGDKHKQLTIVGSKHQDYEKLFSLLAYLEEKIGD